VLPAKVNLASILEVLNSKYGYYIHVQSQILYGKVPGISYLLKRVNLKRVNTLHSSLLNGFVTSETIADVSVLAKGTVAPSHC